MKKGVVLIACFALSGFFLGGCTSTPEAGTVGAGTCPGCGQEMEINAFCTKCTAVATTGEEFECAKEEGKMLKAGTYCSKKNCFRFRETIVCKTCGKTVKKGTYCEEHKVYRGLPAVAYCEKCKKPYARAEGACPRCGTKPEPSS